MKRIAYIFGFCSLLCCGCRTSKNLDSKWLLMWQEDFTTKIDTTKWSFELGDGCPQNCGWGNNELQYYTRFPENARIQDGKLWIEAHKKSYGNKSYTSTKLISKHKVDIKYGKIEVRAKLPKGRGTWPAIWMLPTHWEYGGWPSSGEIDIMEYVGCVPDTIYGTVHTQKLNHIRRTQITRGIFAHDVCDTFHNYGIEWSENEIKFYFDQDNYLTFKNRGNGYEEWPFDKQFYLILNLAVGGNWGGMKGVDESIWPQRMEVDYVKVWKWKS